ncbi:DUF624 domain-containing protein [Rhizobium sp. RU36D]|uniref:DUF624 domain-containing protein n=1 Tax=Rhizobium sp. RU36D TaxID=1907415 RepID=UPI0009D90472|nr:DUF624 domain-containing protein [Rhizobium sp. RU36D]SMD01294.1 Protein of unknown function, DUF624 [Rhizobium sp. RU36D]
MKWLRDRFEREGPGIPKDAPKKRGLALFGQIIGREAWDLFALNLMIVVLSLPIITIPAVHAAATRICVSMVRDENRYLYRDFRDALRDTWVTATLGGMGFAVGLVISGYAIFIYGQLALVNYVYAAPLALAVATFVFVSMIAAHFMVLLAVRPMTLLQLLRLALIATLARPLPALSAFVFVAALWLAHVVFYPVSVFMPAVFNFSLGTLAITFAVLKATDFVLSLPGSTPQGRTKEFADAHMRRR